MPDNPKPSETDVSDLVEICAAFAKKHGVDEMLDTLAGVYQAYAPLSQDAAVQIVCDIAGLITDDATVTDHEGKCLAWYTVH